MALGREDIAVTRTDSGADVFCLVCFLRYDDLICHDGPLEECGISNKTNSELWRITSCRSTRTKIRCCAPILIARAGRSKNLAAT
jgi:hypothetical protein